MLGFLEKNSSVGNQIFNMAINSCYPVGSDSSDVIEYSLKNWMSTFDPSLLYPPFMDTIYSLPTIVHEAYHGVSGIHNGKMVCCTGKEYYHFVESNAEVTVDQSVDYNTTYPNLISEKVRETLPANYRNNPRIDRYLFYQQGTVYSLLNEFAAYYFGVRTDFDFIPYHIEKYRETQDNTHLTLAVRNVEGGISAY